MQCFGNFPVAKKFMDKGGGIKIFRRKNFLTLPKNFAGESFTASLISSIDKY